MRTYIELLKRILNTGEIRDNRTGIDTLSKFGEFIEIDLRQGFPILTTKKVNYMAAIGECLWMLSGDTNIAALHKNNIHIWDSWADEKGNLGPVYGKQWRNFGGVDQIKEIASEIMAHSNSRRIILNSWNVGELSEMQLPPCHVMAQFSVRDRFLDCAVFQRSADAFLGLPFDIISYALMTSLFADMAGLQPRKLVFFLGDVHIYANHIDQCRMQVKRPTANLPEISFPHVSNLDDILNLKISDFEIKGYHPMPAIKGEVAI